MTLTSMLRRLCIPAVAHGFRSSFRDWVAEQTEAPDDVGETAPARSLGPATKKSHKRSDLHEKRRPLMQAWANYIWPIGPDIFCFDEPFLKVPPNIEGVSIGNGPNLFVDRIM